ncbi:hypothetical protein KAS79_04230 [Candidatus Parcubacteria bacterium]|nr:hypothetical protein [Candidatus Parcubacteria bacterium]
MSNEAINLANLQEEANKEVQQRKDFEIVKKVNGKIQAILQKYNCMLVPILNIQGNQTRHLVNIVLKPKDTGIVDKEGQKI